MVLLNVRKLAVGYDGQQVLADLNFTVSAGDYLCIVGENGSGKTTLMKTLLHLQAPLAGQITYGGGLRANEIGYLPQQTLVQRDFPASVREIVLSGCQGRKGLLPFYSREDKALAQENMEKMGIAQFADRCYRELSGGQQQRVLLARALCATSKLLLLDEPVAGLDPKVTAEMYEQIRQLNESGITIIMISHDIAAALTYASHILHIGDEVFFGTRQKYLSSHAGRIFLEHAAGSTAPDGEPSQTGGSSVPAGEGSKTGGSSVPAGEGSKTGGSSVPAGEGSKTGGSSVSVGEGSQTGGSSVSAGEVSQAGGSSLSVGEGSQAAGKSAAGGETSTESRKE